MMLSKSVFLCVLSGVKITLKNPKISWKIFNLNAVVPFCSCAKLSRIASKNNANLTIGFWKKNHEFSYYTPLGGRGGGLRVRESSQLFHLCSVCLSVCFKPEFRIHYR